jgi:hypothetical protein
MAYFELVPTQFKQFDQGIDAVSGAVNRLADRIGPVDKDATLHQAITDLTTEITKWQSIQVDAINAGFALVAEAIAKLNTLPPPQPEQLEVTFVFKVANNHQDEPYSIAIGGVTDAEGESLPDTKGLTVEVTSSDEAVVAAGFDPSTNSGVAHFGTSGVASLNAVVKNANGDILGSGAADFTVTTGDPAAVSDVKISFSGLTEETPEEPPVEG